MHTVRNFVVALVLLWLAGLAPDDAHAADQAAVAVSSPAAQAMPSIEPTLRLDAAEFFPDSPTAPSLPGNAANLPTAGGTRVTLPDNWRLTHPDLNGFAWYVSHFTLAATPGAPLVLYVPRVSQAAEFWLNGSLLNPGVIFDAPGKVGSTMSDMPVYLVLPSGLFRTGDNVLAVRLRGSSQIRSGLSALTIAPPQVVDPSWRLRYALQVVVPYGLMVLMAAAFCFMLAHLRLQRRPHLIQAGLIVGVVAMASYLAIDIPIDRGEQEVLRIVLTTIMYWSLCVVGYRMAGYRLPAVLWGWHALTALTLVAVVVAALTHPLSDRLWLLIWPHELARIVFIALLAFRAWQDRSPKYATLAMTGLIWLITQVQSGFILMEWLSWDAFRWSTVGSMPFCVVLLFVFAERFILDREEAAVAQRQAIVSERGRILQDMHDGMGAHLVTALHMARRPGADREALVRSLEESLQDLRLIIDSLDLPAHNLLPLLANLRYRLEPRLKALDIRLEWDVQPLPVMPGLGPDGALSVLRIVQEAVNNAVQHGQPGTIRIAARAEGGVVDLTVADDGRGFTEMGGRPGSHGLRGMRSRAERLQARLTIDSGAGGTQINLRLGGGMV